MLARLADETVLARMFAGFEAILTLGVAAGVLLAPLVIELLGVRLALLATRTATIRASADANMRVSVMQRSTYLTAVTGYPASSAAGEEVVTARLKADAERRPATSGAD
jgi:hypothetical protein